MNLRSLAPMAGFAVALSIAVPANAAYIGLSCQLHTTVSIDGASYQVWRVYADFTSASDQLTVVSGSAAGGPITILNLNVGGLGPGSGFYNNLYGGPVAPNPAVIAIVPSLQWDTFVTIGAEVGPQPDPDATTLTPGFDLGLIDGTGTTAAESAWFVTPDAPQSFAGADFKVMIAQLTIKPGEIVAGTVNISGVIGSVPGGSFTANGQTFDNFCPTPGAIAFLSVAGLVGSRRRRKACCTFALPTVEFFTPRRRE